MLGLRLMRLVEAHSEELAVGLAEKLRKAERTCDFRGSRRRTCTGERPRFTTT
jgi:hypothetical protein